MLSLTNWNVYDFDSIKLQNGIIERGNRRRNKSDVRFCTIRCKRQDQCCEVLLSKEHWKLLLDADERIRLEHILVRVLCCRQRLKEWSFNCWSFCLSLFLVFPLHLSPYFLASPKLKLIPASSYHDCHRYR
jgi:hypothetical protein